MHICRSNILVGQFLTRWWVLYRAFDGLKEVRQLEYELDFAQNRAARDKAALKERLTASLATTQKLQAQLKAAGAAAPRPPLANVENHVA